VQSPNKFVIAIKALQELGLYQLTNYAVYQLGLKTGYLRWRTPIKSPGIGTRQQAAHSPELQFQPFLRLPDRKRLVASLGDNIPICLAEADEIAKGNVHLFGGPAVPLKLSLPGPLKHWTAYEQGEKVPGYQDIKWVWEPGRFGWAITLGRAFYISGDEKYSQAFWHFTQQFLASNPPNLGPHWASSQEVALRLIAFSLTLHLIINSSHSNSGRVSQLLGAIADHAQRIPLTLGYARAQNNNHLLTEAAGLYTAGYILPDHPKARHWRSLGMRWLDQGLKSQIAEDGTYVQHSTNYHRLMLQIALWANWVGGSNPRIEEAVDNKENRTLFSTLTQARLMSATRWLLALLDYQSGRLPNLGPNDGANILPLTSSPFYDYRPILNTAAHAFLDKRLFPQGPWDEMAMWLGVVNDHQDDDDNTHRSENYLARNLQLSSCDDLPVLRGVHSWAYLRVAKFTGRPGHADQLNLDLWWRGLNLAQDAGTYLYNADQPWDNSLSHTAVHNTISVAGQDQMTRAGRFLWLDWAQGQIIDYEKTGDGALKRLMAQHDGYKSLGVIHRREVVVLAKDRWMVEDQLIPSSSPDKPRSDLTTGKIVDPKGKAFDIRIHWLLPDWPWELEKSEHEPEYQLRLKSPHDWITLRTLLKSDSPFPAHQNAPIIRIIRAGEMLQGPGPAEPTFGWVSPTYGVKVPSISFSLEVKSALPLRIITQWVFP